MTIFATIHPDQLALIDEILMDWRGRYGAVAEPTRENCRLTVATFAVWLDGRDTTLTAATPADCRDWLAARAEEVAPSTVVKNYGQLRSFYRLAETDIGDPLAGGRSPMARIPQPKAPKYAKTHAATVAEFDALIATFDRRTTHGLRNAAMMSFMFRTGARVGELAQIDLRDVDLEARRVELGWTKNGEPRVVPLHPETVRYLRRYVVRRGDWAGPLFVNTGRRRTSERLTTNAIQNIVKRAAARAGVPVTPHTFRRGFAVEYVANGGDVATGMTIGGWANPIMMHRYFADRRVDVAQAVLEDVAKRQARNEAGRRLRAL